jgi:hypothetical protein
MYPNNGNCPPCPSPIVPIPIPDYSHTLCNMNYDGNCVIYTGPNVDCVGIKTGMTFNVVSALISDALINTCKIKSDCVLSEWGPWSGCTTNERIIGPTSEIRCRTIITPGCNAGKPCPDNLCESRSCTPPFPLLQATWYNMIASPKDVINTLINNCYGPLVNSITITITHFEVNGGENLLSGNYDIIVDNTNINKVSATNDVRVNCYAAPNYYIGATYTNYADGINAMISSVGISHIHAETSYISVTNPLSHQPNSTAGVYIVFPIGSTFKIDFEVGYQKYRYDENFIYLWNGSGWEISPIDWGYFSYLTNIPFPLL